MTAEIAAKSLLKAQTAIREAGADNMLQGRLVAGDRVAEAGLSAQPKAAKPAPRSKPRNQSWVGGEVCGGAGASTHEPRAYDCPGDLYGQDPI